MIFSPTDVMDWLRCPQYRQHKQRWRLKDDEWTPNMLIGTMLHAAVAQVYRGLPNSEPMEPLLDAGWVEQEKWSKERVLKVAKGALSACMPKCLYILGHEDVVAVESEILIDGEYAGTPDLITRGDDGLIVTDLKFSLEVDPRYRVRRLAEYDCSYQLWAYADLVQLIYGELPAWLRVHQVYGLPKADDAIVTIRCTHERLDLWQLGAEVWQVRMQEDSSWPPLPNFTNCFGKYGKCDYYAACHQCQNDPALMEVLYAHR